MFYDSTSTKLQTLDSNNNKDSTGVGLSIVKKIIEMQGGKIWIESPTFYDKESEKSFGSTFFFTLKNDV